MSTSSESALEELERERAALDIPGTGAIGNGMSLHERAEALPEPVDDGEEEDVEELFVIEQGRRVPISRLITEGIPIEYSVNLNSRSFRGGGSMGLLPFTDPEMILIVPTRQGKVIVDPTYSDEGYVEKVSIRANLRPLNAHDLKSREGRALAGLPEDED